MLNDPLQALAPESAPLSALLGCCSVAALTSLASSYRLRMCAMAIGCRSRRCSRRSTSRRVGPSSKRKAWTSRCVRLSVVPYPIAGSAAWLGARSGMAQALIGLSDDNLKQLGVVKIGLRSKLKQRAVAIVNSVGTALQATS